LWTYFLQTRHMLLKPGSLLAPSLPPLLYAIMLPSFVLVMSID